MSQIKIDKNVPIPERMYGGNWSKYPFRRLEIGDSLFVDGKTAAQFGGTVSHWKAATGFKFTCRTVDGGCRVWRIE